MEQIKSPLAKLLEEMAALTENRTETALAVASPKPRLPEKKLNALFGSGENVGQQTVVKTPSKDCLNSQEQLSRLLKQCYVMLKKYGEVGNATEMRDEGFQMVLGEYSIEDVNRAFMQYLKTGREIPTPAE